MASNSLTTREPKVTVSELPYNPKNKDWGLLEVLAYSSRISHDQQGRSAWEMWQAERQGTEAAEQRQQLQSFLKKLAKMGHTSCFYQANFGLSYEIPRHTTLFLCSFDHSKFLQQSQRYTKAQEFMTMLGEEAVPLFSKQRDLYLRMIEAEVPKEDARYILPLAMGATHLHQNTNFIALANMLRVVNSDNVLLPSLTKEIVEEARSQLGELVPSLFDSELVEIYNENDKFFPVANMFSQGNKWVNQVASASNNAGEPVDNFSYDVTQELRSEAAAGNDQALTFLNLANSIETVKGNLAPMSLAAWHQFMRNDTTKNSVESVYDAADREKVVIPHSIEESSFLEDYLDLFQESLQSYHRLSSKHGPAIAIEVIPHALEINVAFSLDGFNLVRGFIKDRAQEAAQWEIRRIARSIKSRLEGS